MAAAAATPRIAPLAATRALSISSCLIMRPALAPRAARSARSRSRDANRASSRFATFAHAITSTRTTAPMSTSSGVRTGPASSSASGMATTPDSDA